MIEELHDIHGDGSEMIRSKCDLEGHENVVTYAFNCIVSISAWRRSFYQMV